MTLGAAPEAASEIWFALHGYGQLARRFTRRLAPLAGAGRLVVVPEGLSRFYVDEPRGIVGACWMTREDRGNEIDDYVRYLDGLAAAILPAGAARPPVHLLGFSQGSATACRWVERGAIAPVRLVLWGGEIPPDIDWTHAARRFRALEVLLVAGDRDEIATPEALTRYAELLAAQGVRHRVVRYPGDHAVDGAAVERLAAGTL